jgi:D-hydroxyproline dehydrogenase subunit gamma
MTAVMVQKQAGLVDVTVDGVALRLQDGMMLATALAGVGILMLRRSPRGQMPRGAFCFMGACQECIVHVDGTLRQACMTPIAADMVIQIEGAP